MEHLRRSPFTKCVIAAERLDFQDENINYDDVGVYLEEQPAKFPDRYGGSAPDVPNNGFFDITILYPKAFESDHQLALTLVHEAYGHQILNNRDEWIAESEAQACGTEN